MPDIKAIPTQYHGYKFRSRLEARFAVFFDALNQGFRYEPEGYNLERGLNYLPDFFLDAGYFVEIKPYYPNAIEMRKAQLLAKQTKTKVYIFYGDLSLPVIDLKAQKRTGGFCALRFLPNGQVKDLMIPKFIKEKLTFIACPKKLKIQSEIESAILKGKQARFEFGETPKQASHQWMVSFLRKLRT